MAFSLPLSAWAVDLGSSGLSDAGSKAGINTTGTEGSLGSLVGLIVNVALNLLGLIIFVIFIYAGILWMTAQGEPKQTQKAKDMMKNALAGLIIVFFALSLVTFIAGQFSAGGSLGTSTTTYENAVTGAGFTAANADLMQNIGAIIGVALNLLGVVLLAIFLYAGFLWMTAQGESKQTQKAKDMMRNAIIGLIITLSARILANFVVDRIAGTDGVLATFLENVPIHNTNV